jgi:hypothetical protein
MSSCTKHPHEPMVATCRRCAQPWCTTCLVYTYGASKPPYCIACAMVASGVRTNGAPPAASRKELKARAKEAKRAAKEAKRAAKAGPAAAEAVEADGTAGAAGDGDTERTMADWSAPWWEAAEADERTAVD